MLHGNTFSKLQMFTVYFLWYSILISFLRCHHQESRWISYQLYVIVFLFITLGLTLFVYCRWLIIPLSSVGSDDLKLLLSIFIYLSLHFFKLVTTYTFTVQWLFVSLYKPKWLAMFPFRQKSYIIWLWFRTTSDVPVR